MEQEQEIEQVVEEVVEEQQSEESAEYETPAPSMDMDFSDIGFPDEAPRQEEPDYEGVIENVVSKVLAQQKIKLEEDKSEDDDDDMTYLSKKDLAEYEKNIENKIFQKFQEQQNAQKVIQEAVQGSEIVRTQYANKFAAHLAANGYDLEQNPQLRASAEHLFDNLKMKYAASKGRLSIDPSTGQPVAILSPQEMKGLVQTHWSQFSKQYGLQPNKSVATTQSLSPASNGRQAAPGVDTSDVYAEFMKKKARGEETLSDVMNLLSKTSGKK
jgi:electron transfer flavoprotein alpha subunit